MRLLSIIITLGVVTITSIQAQNWQTDIDQAKVLAAKENRKIVLVFQGSDWCAPCIKLEREIWSTEEFNDYAKDHFIMLQADFPRKKNNQLSVDLQEPLPSFRRPTLRPDGMVMTSCSWSVQKPVVST